jgi:hypothetical protein
MVPRAGWSAEANASDTHCRDPSTGSRSGLLRLRAIQPRRLLIAVLRLQRSGRALVTFFP